MGVERHSRTGFTFLRPIQVEYESPKFMLPIRRDYKVEHRDGETDERGGD
jgi:hypothetical protein